MDLNLVLNQPTLDQKINLMAPSFLLEKILDGQSENFGHPCLESENYTV